MLVMQRPTVEPIVEEEGNRQRFAVGPLDPGFGHTLGNSLRRTLLSSIPGAAITQVRFDDALHEFDTIPGVVEDVTVIILNPELHLATLNKSGRIAVDITVAKGRGYRSAEANKSSETIGVIPVDSIFAPVRRGAFDVRPPPGEQATEDDPGGLDIQTDGSISPRDALASAGDTLRSLVSLVADMSEEPQGLELGELAITSAGSPDLDLPIEDLDLSERPRNCLKRAQVNSVGELVTKSEDDLLAITNFGQKSLDEVLVKLDERGLALR